MNDFFRAIDTWSPVVMPWFFLVAFLVMGYRIWRAVSAFREMGRPIRPQVPGDTLFAESGASGHYVLNLMSRLSGASRILYVWVSRQEFGVDMTFPFNLFIYGDGRDYYQRVPIRSVTSVESAKDWVLVSFDDAKHQPRQMRLLLKDAGKFMSAMKLLGVRGA